MGIYSSFLGLGIACMLVVTRKAISKVVKRKICFLFIFDVVLAIVTAKVRFSEQKTKRILSFFEQACFGMMGSTYVIDVKSRPSLSFEAS